MNFMVLLNNKYMTDKEQELIDDVMDNFDFERVHKVMKSLRWKWHSIDATPSVQELKGKAREIMKDAINNNEASNGGFYSIYVHREDSCLKLFFSVEYWEANS